MSIRFYYPLALMFLCTALMISCTTFPASRKHPPQVSSPEYDEYGGVKSITGTATGRFHIENIDGVDWFITPAGHGFFSAGMNHVTYTRVYNPEGSSGASGGTRASYKNLDDWARTAMLRLRYWGFNTVGAWSKFELFENEFPVAPILYFSKLAPNVPDSKGSGLFGGFSKLLRDFYAPSFTEGVAGYAKANVGRWAQNPYCVGLFSDNELPWGVSAIQGTSYLDAYLSLPAEAPGKLAVQHFFEERYNGDVDAYNRVWRPNIDAFDDLQQQNSFRRKLKYETGKQKADRVAFRTRVATHYFKTVHDAIRSVDPEILILGSRFVSIFTAPDVIEAAGPYVDVVSVNSYHFVNGTRTVMSLFFGQDKKLFGRSPWSDLAEVHRLTDKPVMITEYSYRAKVKDGPPSDHPPGYLRFNDQQSRADYYSHYMNHLYDFPFVVGAHWFEYCDQPALGRGDGENNNFGVIDIHDEIYVELADAMRGMNHAVLVRTKAGE